MHSHGHSHSQGSVHSHDHSGASSRNALWGLFALSVFYLFAEIVGGLVSGSLALLADAGHMAIDAFAMGLSLFAFWIARKPPTQKNTYGYYRAEILAALLNGATLVAVSLWIIYEAVQRFQSPQPVAGETMTLVASGGLVVNLIGLAVMFRRSQENLNLRGVWLHLLTDTLGSLAALGAGALVWGFGWTLADPIISIVISLLILLGSWSLLSDCVNVLLEASPKHIDVAEVQKALEKLARVQEVHDLHIWTVTSGVVSLSAHVRVGEKTDHASVLESITSLLKERFHIEHVTVQLEPPAYSHKDMHF